LPREVGAYDTVGYWWNFYAAAIEDSFAFTGGVSVLRSVLISDPANPILVGTGPPAALQMPHSIIVRDNRLYSSEEGRFHIFDISLPRSPAMMAELRMPIWTDGMSLQDTLAFVGCGFTGLFPINVARPASPFIVDTIPVRGGVKEVVIRDTIAYVTAFYDSGVRVVNIKNLHAPFEVSSLRMPSACGIAGVENLLYVAYAQGFMVVDVSDPAHLVEVGHYDYPGGSPRIIIDSDLIYCPRGGAGFLILERIPTGSREANPCPPPCIVTVFPSIVRDKAEIHINRTKGGVIKAQIFDAQGRMARRKMLVPSAGSSNISFDLSRLPVGVYFIQLETDQQVTIHRIVKITR
jgi:hypothetical protein